MAVYTWFTYIPKLFFFFVFVSHTHLSWIAIHSWFIHETRNDNFSFLCWFTRGYHQKPFKLAAPSCLENLLHWLVMGIPILACENPQCVQGSIAVINQSSILFHIFDCETPAKDYSQFDQAGFPKWVCHVLEFIRGPQIQGSIALFFRLNDHYYLMQIRNFQSHPNIISSWLMIPTISSYFLT